MQIMFSYGEKTLALLQTIGEWIFATPNESWAEPFLFILEHWRNLPGVYQPFIDDILIPIIEGAATLTIAEFILGTTAIALLSYSLIKFFTDIVL